MSIIGNVNTRYYLFTYFKMDRQEKGFQCSLSILMQLLKYEYERLNIIKNLFNLFIFRRKLLSLIFENNVRCISVCKFHLL